jgi:hypothetical protein
MQQSMMAARNEDRAEHEKARRKQRVRVGGVYVFRHDGLDAMMPQHYDAAAGQRVRVINLPGAPRCGTMGQCHIEDASSGAFLGMVSVRSLQRS